MSYKVFVFPAVISAVLLFSTFFRLGPDLDRAIEQDRAFSAKFEALPGRVESGEITANAAVNFASVSVPKYAAGSAKIVSSLQSLLYAQAALLSAFLFLSAYLASRVSQQAPNHSLKRTPNGAA